MKKCGPSKTVSAADTASFINEDLIDLLRGMIKDTSISLNMGTILNAKPNKVMDMLGQVPRMGIDPCDLLDKRAELCMMGTKQASMASAVPALNCSTRFAADILGYDINEIPPSTDGAAGGVVRCQVPECRQALLRITLGPFGGSAG